MTYPTWHDQDEEYTWCWSPNWFMAVCGLPSSFCKIRDWVGWSVYGLVHSYRGRTVTPRRGP